MTECERPHPETSEPASKPTSTAAPVTTDLGCRADDDELRCDPLRNGQPGRRVDDAVWCARPGCRIGDRRSNLARMRRRRGPACGTCGALAQDIVLAHPQRLGDGRNEAMVLVLDVEAARRAPPVCARALALAAVTAVIFDPIYQVLTAVQTNSPQTPAPRCECVRPTQGLFPI